MTTVPSTRSQRVEFWVLFALLVPFYLFLLPKEGRPIQTLGFVYLACLAGYMIFLSPNRGRTHAQRRSLLEVPAIVGWIMFAMWAVVPRGKVGVAVGISMLSLSLLYIIFLSARFNRDTPDDWGLGSPVRLIRAIRSKEKGRRIAGAILGVNVAILILSMVANRLTSEIIRKVLRQSFSIKLEGDLSIFAASLIAMIVLNLLIFCVIRYDNLRRASLIVGLYLISLLALITVVGTVFIYLIQGGAVVFTPVNGMKSVGTYVIWGIVQELLFLSYFNTRIRKGMDSPWLSALLTAVVFSLFHLTAYTLMFMCFLIGIVWALIFQAAPNVFLLGVAHGVSGGFGSAFDVKGVHLPEVKATVGPFNL